MNRMHKTMNKRILHRMDNGFLTHCKDIEISHQNQGNTPTKAFLAVVILIKLLYNIKVRLAHYAFSQSEEKLGGSIEYE